MLFRCTKNMNHELLEGHGTTSSDSSKLRRSNRPSARTKEGPDANLAPTFAAGWLTVLRRYLLATAALDLVWETVHLPLYTIWAEASIRYKVFTAFHCTLGDVLIASAALVAALVAVGRSSWPELHWARVAGVTLAIGLAYTAYSEYVNVELRHSWAYTRFMPVLPFLGTGLSPILQWIVVPLSALQWARRYVWARRR